MRDPYDPARDGGHFETHSSTFVNATSATVPVVAGDGARRRVVLALTSSDDTTVENSCHVQFGAGANGAPRIVLSEGMPSIVLRYEDFGDALFQPIFCIFLDAGTLTVTTVQWHPERRGE